MLNRLKKAIIQAKTGVTPESLLTGGFIQDGIKFKMGDLTLRKIGTMFYYKDAKGKLIKIKNMFTVSRLVYGRLEYGR